MELNEEIKEFLIECNENLVNLDQEIVLLEQSPENTALIASVFRTFHTIKGTCGFFGFSMLGEIAHGAESLLDQIREGTRCLTPELSALLLESVDAIKEVIASIEGDGHEGSGNYQALCKRLKDAYQGAVAPVAAAEKRVAAPAVPSPEKQLPVAEIETAANAKNPALTDSTIRVDVGLLDKLMNLVGELVLARNQLLQSTTEQNSLWTRTVQRLNAITSELQEGVLKTRMQPIGVVWNKLPRVVRDLAAECGKKIQITMEGADTELDKTIIEAIKDPLTHIVRNACDHGIESPETRTLLGKDAEGIVSLRAYHEGGHVNIEIADDGRGLDVEKLKAKAISKGLIRPEEAASMPEREAMQLVFMPGFSTAEQITAISGRGVGMDVVKTNIQKIGGIVDIGNRIGAPGTTVKIKIPLTLAIIPGLIVNATGKEGSSLKDDQRFVIPQANLLELVRLEQQNTQKQIEYVNGTPVYRRRGQLLPLTYLNRVLGLEDVNFPSSEVINIVVLQAEDRPFGLVVDGISDTQEIVVKPLGKRLKGLSSYLGATIMGDGHVALILDIPGLARLAGLLAQSREIKKQENANTEPARDNKQSFLVFCAGSFERLAVPLALVSRLEQIESSSIQYAAERAVLHYRGQILPLLHFANLIDTRSAAKKELPQNMQVVVLGEGAHRVGIIVDRILDIVEETVTFRQRSKHVGLLGSVILGNAITDLVDVQGLLEVAGEGAMQDSMDEDGQQSILVLGSSSLSRIMHKDFLEMHGYRVLEAESEESAIQMVRSSSIASVLVMADTLLDKRSTLAGDLRSANRAAKVPVICMSSGNVSTRVYEGNASFDAVIHSSRREELLQTVRELSQKQETEVTR